MQDKQKFEALREDPTFDAHWALWVDCMRELARTFFSLHRTPKMDDAQKRLSALRRKLISEQALSREQMGTFRETHGHEGDCSEQHLHARHKLMTLQRQLRRRTKQSAAALRTSLESELHRALKDGRRHEGHRLTQLLGGQGIGLRTMPFSKAKNMRHAGVRPQNSSLCALRHRICRWDRGDWKASVWKKSLNQQRRIHAQKESWSLFWYTPNEHSAHHAAHTTQTAPCSRNITERKECWAPEKSRPQPFVRSLFAALVRNGRGGRI